MFASPAVFRVGRGVGVGGRGVFVGGIGVAVGGRGVFVAATGVDVATAVGDFTPAGSTGKGVAVAIISWGRVASGVGVAGTRWTGVGVFVGVGVGEGAAAHPVIHAARIVKAKRENQRRILETSKQPRCRASFVIERPQVERYAHCCPDLRLNDKRQPPRSERSGRLQSPNTAGRLVAQMKQGPARAVS